MRKKMFYMMRRWINALNSSGKLDRVYLMEDFNALNRFIRVENNRRLVTMAKDCRDYPLSTVFSLETLIKKINRFLAKLEELNREEEKKAAVKINMEAESMGQSERYRDATRRIYSERLRFNDKVRLRNFDVNMATPSDSRKVRRIVEKRMCQAYHRQSRTSGHDDSNRRRHDMRRAVSYQLHNLGQIEEVTHRNVNSHWKPAVDCVTGKRVLKPKQAYNSLEDAEMAAQHYTKRHPREALPMVAYKCAYCNKYHIGHDHATAHSLATA